MAAIKVTITGVLIDLYGRTISGPLKMVGEMVRTDVGVGGGPIVPPDGGEGEKPPRPPLGIWPGPGDPDFPGDGKPPVPPPSIWPPGPGIDFPEHPIVVPPPITDPPKPIPPGTLITWTPVWTPGRGWFVVGVPNVPHPAPA